MQGHRVRSVSTFVYPPAGDPRICILWVGDVLDLPLRASNEAIPMARVARAQEIEHVATSLFGSKGRTRCPCRPPFLTPFQPPL